MLLALLGFLLTHFCPTPLAPQFLYVCWIYYLFLSLSQPQKPVSFGVLNLCPISTGFKLNCFWCRRWLLSICLAAPRANFFLSFFFFHDNIPFNAFLTLTLHFIHISHFNNKNHRLKTNISISRVKDLSLDLLLLLFVSEL